MTKQKRIELNLSVPVSVAKSIMLLIHHQSMGSYVEVPTEGGKVMKYEFFNGAVVGKLPMKVLNEALKDKGNE